MGYLERILGDRERVVYQTRQHLVVLLLRAIGSFLAFVVLLVLGLSILVPPNDQTGSTIRFWVGVITLVGLVIPLYLIISAWIRGERGRDFLRAIWRAALAGLVIVVVSLVLMINPQLRLTGWIGIVIAFIPLAELVRIVLDWWNERYLITNRRVMEVRGTINKHVRDSALEKVNDVELNQSVVGRLLGFGTVQIITGSDIGVNKFQRISKPVHFKRAMLNAKEDLHTVLPAAVDEQAAQGRPAEEIEAGEIDAEPPADVDIPDLLVELDELRQKGIISDEEFQAKKKELLSRL
jgi:hypothetical protein